MNVSDSKYYNLIINVSGESYECEILSDRIKQKNRDVDVVILDMKKGFDHQPTENEINAFKKINPNSRILILAHTAPNSPYLGYSHFKTIADFFGKCIKPNQACKGKKHLKISILGCHSGKGEQSGAKSFAGLFHRALKEMTLIDSRVTARNEFVSVTPLSRLKGKTTSSFLSVGINKIIGKHLSVNYQDKLHVHKKPGSKTTFKWDAMGNQVTIDSYLEKFADNLFVIVDQIQKCKKNMKKENEVLVDKGLVDLLVVLNKLKSEERLGLDYKTVVELAKNLSFITSIFERDDKVEDFKFIIESIKKLVDFSKKSISKKSEKFKTITKSEEITKSEKKTVPVDVQFKNLLQDYLLEKAKLPKTDNEKLITEFFIKFAMFRGKLSWDSFSYKVLNGLDPSVDVAFYKFLFSVFKTINSDLNKEYKKKLIEKEFQSAYTVQTKNNLKDLDRIDLKYKKWMKEFFGISIDYLDSLSILEENIVKNEVDSGEKNVINEVDFEEKIVIFTQEKEKLITSIENKFDLLDANLDVDEIVGLYNELSFCYVDCLNVFNYKIPESLSRSMSSLRDSIKNSLLDARESIDFKIHEQKENIAKLSVLKNEIENKIEVLEFGSNKYNKLVEKIERIELEMDLEEISIYTNLITKKLMFNAEKNFSMK